MVKKIVFISLLAILLGFAGCTTDIDINTIKSEDYVGENVQVTGTVRNSVSIGGISGFIVEDETGSIPVSSGSVPEPGTIVEVEGILLEDTVIGYYIQANNWEEN